MYAGIISAGLNTFLNYGLIFGKLGMPMLGVKGAALASVISQLLGAITILVMFFTLYKKLHISINLGKGGYLQYFVMLLPVVINEFLWSVGQSISGLQKTLRIWFYWIDNSFCYYRSLSLSLCKIF